MPPRSKVTKLPDDIKTWLDQVLIANSFGGYDALEAELRERGYNIGKSSLQRYGATFEERLGALKRSTEMARAIATEAGDDEGATNDAVVRLLQEKFFGALTDPDKPLSFEDMTDFAHAISSLSRASVQVKTYASKVRKEDAAKLAKLEAEATAATGAGKKGLDLETLKKVRQALYGF